MGQAKRRTRSKPAWQCETEGCDNEAYCLDLCSACYSYMYNWTRKKTPAQRRARVKKLELFETRMEAIAASARPRRVK